MLNDMPANGMRDIRRTILAGVVFLTFTATVAAGCGGEEARSFEISDDVHRYYDDWNGDPSLPGVDVQPLSGRGEWDELIMRAERRGLTDFSDRDRTLLVAGALKAFLISAERIRYYISVPPDGTAQITEEYRPDARGLHYRTRSRSEVFERVLARWPGVPIRSDDVGERRFFVDESLEMTVWIKTQDGNWECEIVNGAVYGEPESAQIRLARLVSIAVSKVTGAQTNNDGTVDWLLVSADATVVLDGDTLWPESFMFQTDGPENTVVAIELINSTDEIEPPLDGVCGRSS